MPNKPTLIVVADAGRVKLFATDNRGASIASVQGGLDALPNPPAHEQLSDRPGRTHQAIGARRASMEPRSDPHQKMEEEFARTLARHLNGLLGTDSYKDVLVFAPPVMLGNLRRDLSPAVAAKIVGEVHKDLTKSPTEEVRSHVRQALFPDE